MRLPLIILLVHLCGTYALREINYRVQSLRPKCVNLAYLSYFNEKTQTCFIRTDLACSSIQFAAPVWQGTIDADDEKGMKKSRVIQRDENYATVKYKICAFRREHRCGHNSVLVGTDCFALGDTETTWDVATGYCNARLMHVFVPHSDHHLQVALELTQETNPKSSNEIWLGSLKRNKDVSLENTDWTEEDYFRWQHGTKFSSASVATTAVNNKNTNYGYQSMADVDTKKSFICHRPASCVYYNPPPFKAAPTTTTTTTTTTKPPPPVKKLILRGKPKGTNWFVVNLMNKYSEDIALMVHPVMREKAIYLKTRINGKYTYSQKLNRMPFSQNVPFTLEVIFGKTSYEIRVNGQYLATYRHRMSSTLVNSLFMPADDLLMTHVQPVLFKGEPKSVILSAGKTMTVRGRPTKNSFRWSINIGNSKNQIIFHIVPEYTIGTTVLNALINLHKWGTSEIHRYLPPRGQDLVMKISNLASGFSVTINGKYFATMRHRASRYDVTGAFTCQDFVMTSMEVN